MPFNILHDLLGKLRFFIVILVLLLFFSVASLRVWGRKKMVKMCWKETRSMFFFLLLLTISNKYEECITMLHNIPSPCTAINSVDGLIYVHVNHEKWFIGFCIWSFRCGFLRGSRESSQLTAILDADNRKKLVFSHSRIHAMYIIHELKLNGRIQTERWEFQHPTAAAWGGQVKRGERACVWAKSRNQSVDSECLNRYWWADLAVHICASCCTTHNIVVE